MEPVRLSTVEVLLTNYPNILKTEVSDIISFLRTASVIDICLLGSNRSLSAKLARFKQDNGAELSLQRTDFVALAVMVAFMAAILITQL